MAELPTGYLLRAPTRSDAGAVASVVQALDIADFGEPDFSQDDLLDDWMRPRFDLANDAWVLTGPTGRVVGYAYVWESQPDRELEGDAYVLPEYVGRGLGGALLELVEARASVVAGGRPMTLGVFASRANEGKRNLLERRGFVRARTVLRLRADLERLDLDAEDPRGLSIGSMRPGDEDSVRAVWKDAFASHGRFSPRGMDEWLDARFGHPAFDPALCQLARTDDGELLGGIIAFDVGDTGYTSSVAVRPGARGRGLGPALVRAAFTALRDRGQMRVIVAVDAEGAAGLQELYEAAGMRVHERHDLFVKPLR